MAGASRSYVLFFATACFIIVAGLYLRGLATDHAASTVQTLSFQSAGQSALGVQVSSSSTSIRPGQIVTLTASLSGGTEPYTVKWYSGTNQICSYDTNLIQTDSGLYKTADLLSVYPPSGGAYYCASVADSASPAAAATSSVVGITVSSGSSTTVYSVSTSTTVSSTTITVLPAGTSGIVTQLCAIVNEVRSIIGIIALVLFMVGGLMYAISHFLPTNLEFKKSMTTWSTAMIIGGVIGLVIVLIAQPLIIAIISLGQSAGGVSLPLITC